MAKASTLFEIMSRDKVDVDEMAFHMNNDLFLTKTGGMFVTSIIGNYNIITDEISWVNAGHQPAIIRDNKGNFEEFELAWIADDATSSFGSPLVAGDFLYLVNRAGVATCHDLADGKKRWDLRLPGSCWASPLHAPERIYFFTKEGETIVLKDDGSEEILAQNKLSIEGRVYGFAVADSKFVLRTGSALICLGGLD